MHRNKSNSSNWKAELLNTGCKSWADTLHLLLSISVSYKKRQVYLLLIYQGWKENMSSNHSYKEDGLYGWHLLTQSSPVLWTCIKSFLQDVRLTAKPCFLKGHPPAKTQNHQIQQMWQMFDSTMVKKLFFIFGLIKIRHCSCFLSTYTPLMTSIDCVLLFA